MYFSFCPIISLKYWILSLSQAPKSLSNQTMREAKITFNVRSEGISCDQRPQIDTALFYGVTGKCREPSRDRYDGISLMVDQIVFLTVHTVIIFFRSKSFVSCIVLYYKLHAHPLYIRQCIQ